jgi:FkbM family methyltransferase
MKALRSIVGRARRKFLPLHGYITPGDYLRVRRTPAFQITKTEFLGKPLWFSNKDGFIHSFEEIFRTRVYDFPTSKSSPYIIDAGANIGLAIIFFKQRFPECRITAFEPDPAIFALLNKNIEARGYRDVDLREAAAWIKEETLTFYSEGSLSGSLAVDFLNANNTYTVRAEKLRSLLTNATVDLLKIDIEGAEADVLFDIQDTLGSVENLFFEYHSIPDKPQVLGQLLDLVKKAGFRFIIDGAHGPSSPFLRRSTNAYDNQMNISCFRP